jgi:hypothetical protein
MENTAVAQITSPEPGRGRRRLKVMAGTLMALIPVSGGVAFFVLQLMGTAAAGATGGCGGG